MPTKPRLNRQSVFYVFLWMLSFVAIIEAQGPNSNPQTKPAMFRVAGRVVSSMDGHALARAHIFLTDTRNPQGKRWTTASDTGHFDFDQVAKGKYSLEGANRGFISQAYDQHEQFSTAIVTGPDMSTEDLLLRLPPAGMLAVKVTDELSDPVRKASVILYREDRSTGVRRVVGAMSSSTDDLGACDFTRLIPGVYFVGVSAKPWYSFHPFARTDGEENPSAYDMRSFDVVYAPTYYGDTTDPDSATPITIRGGDQAQAEIHLTPVPALHLLFHAPENGQPGFPRLQKLGFVGTELNPMTETQYISPGLFEMTGIAPGRYTVTLPGSSPTEVDIATNGQDLSQVKGEVASTVEASVRLLGEAQLPQPLYILLRPGNGTNTGVQAMADDKGKASFANVVPGRYNFFAITGGTTGVKHYSVANVSSQGNVTAGPSLNVPPGSALTVSVSLVAGTVNVEGFAKRGDKAVPGAMVVLVPKNPESSRELFRRDQSDLDGSFTLQGIAPGSYTVVAIEDGWKMDWSLPTVIGPYAKHGQTVTVSYQRGQSVQLPEPVEVQLHH